VNTLITVKSGVFHFLGAERDVALSTSSRNPSGSESRVAAREEK